MKRKTSKKPAQHAARNNHLSAATKADAKHSNGQHSAEKLEANQQIIDEHLSAVGLHGHDESSPKSLRDLFHMFANQCARVLGSAGSFIVALVVIIVWGITGPIFQFSDTWQLVINTGTTIVTFLMVFLIQNTQNRDARALHLKLDELLRALGEARTGMVDLESMSEDELDQLESEFKRIRKAC